MKSKSLITILIIAIVGALAAAWYFMWYIPHTPAYTLKIIHQAVQDKDADEALRHIDTKSIVKNILESYDLEYSFKPYEQGMRFKIRIENKEKDDI